MYCGPPFLSSSARRMAETFCARLASSTNVPGHNRFINSSFVSKRPLFSTSRTNASKALGASGTR